MIEFPASLPHPQIEGYGGETDAGVARVAMEGGNTRSRRRFAHLPTSWRVVWRVSTTAERAALAAFYVAVGSDPFIIQLMIPGDPFGLRPMSARFAGGLQYSAISRTVGDVSAVLTTEDAPVVLDAGALVSPDASPLISPDGGEIHWQELT